MKKLYILIVIFLLLLNGCNINHVIKFNKKSDGNSSILKFPEINIPIDKKKHIKKLDEYSSAYSVAYENKDGTKTLYFCAQPIIYDYNLSIPKFISQNINQTQNRVLEENGYSYENVNSNTAIYFPNNIEKEKGIILKNNDIKIDLEVNNFHFAKLKSNKNIYGDFLNSVSYNSNTSDKLNCYPTKSGISLEYVIKELPKTSQLQFSVKTNSDFNIKRQDEYICFYKGDSEKNSFIIYPGLSKGNKGNVWINTVNILKSDQKNRYNIYINLDKTLMKKENFPLIVHSTIDLYNEKIFYDCAEYSNIPYNCYLSDIAFIGKNVKYNNGINYTRFDFNKLNKKFLKSKILSAKYFCKVIKLNNISNNFKIQNVIESWSSTKINNTSKLELDPNMIEMRLVKNNWFSCDISDIIRNYLESGTLSSQCSFAMRLINCNDWNAVCTSDNSLYPPVLVIDYLD